MSFPVAWGLAIVAVLHFPLLVCVTYLIDKFFREEEGPFQVFARIRRAAGIAVPIIDGEIVLDGDALTGIDYETAVNGLGIDPEHLNIRYGSNGGYWAEVLSCYKCFSPYAATIALLTFAFPPLFYVLAAAGANIMLKDGADNNKDECQ